MRVSNNDGYEDKKIIGLYDFDKEGREQIHQLKKEPFWDENYSGNKKNGFYPNEMLYRRIIKNLLYNFFYYLEYFFYQKQKAHQNLSDKKGSDYYMNTIFLIENPKEALKKQIVKNR